MTVTKQQIDDFLKAQSIAIAGVSTDERKFGRKVFDELVKSGYQVLPINPNTNNINGHVCYQSVNELPEHTESLLIITPKNETDKVLKEAINKGIKNIWVQQFSNTENTIAIAEEYQQEIIHSKCIFMFAEPVKGFHKFHKQLLKVFGRLPN
ncbi:CoA-binding protein [Carboxylicivirga sediminis]|uniref:CoA-binding protein n=1 Tax=Carboxylicivirga sediminis TaxID=2006564 RepID=A0A941F330_9BACT|nr:CoA-binding protein [Carboxylicivirga sediminis]MBR8535039.1 CoA-binding protein [Carboxylicivirga sediminis]